MTIDVYDVVHSVTQLTYSFKTMTQQNHCSAISLEEFGKEVIRVDDKGFHYNGQFIADAGEAHRLLVEYLKRHTKS